MKIQFGLMGGLGNQLFQMCAALTVATKYNQTVLLNPNFGFVRENAKGDPEILSFALPHSLKVARRGIHRYWVPKLFGHSRKISISPVGYEKFWAYGRMVKILSYVQAVFLIGPKAQIKFIEEVGFHNLDEITDNTLVLGYFQSYRYASDSEVKTALMSLSTSEFAEVQEFYRDLRSNTNPLVVHIRLGDYLQESNFGVVSEVYYRAAIESEFQTGLYDSIWLFSDDFDLASRMIPNNYVSKIRKVHEAQKSSAATLEIMRHGKGFVIGNSTFSWWGAMLAHAQDARVTAPSPWFRGMHEPKDLIPPNWLRIQAWSQNEDER